jgi:hypothetical protein
MDEPERSRTVDALRRVAQENCRDGVVALRAAAWIVTARRI